MMLNLSVTKIPRTMLLRLLKRQKTFGIDGEDFKGNKRIEEYQEQTLGKELAVLAELLLLLNLLMVGNSSGETGFSLQVKK